MPVFNITTHERFLVTMDYSAVEADTLEDAVHRCINGEVDGYRDEHDFEKFLSVQNAYDHNGNDIPDAEIHAVNQKMRTLGLISDDQPTLTPRELATVLAALRYWQREGKHSCGHEHEIASENETMEPLTAEEIDALCERLNAESNDELPTSCECDNTHQANDTVCRWCWSHGRRRWNDAEVTHDNPEHPVSEA